MAKATTTTAATVLVEQVRTKHLAVHTTYASTVARVLRKRGCIDLDERFEWSTFKVDDGPGVPVFVRTDRAVKGGHGPVNVVKITAAGPAKFTMSGAQEFLDAAILEGYYS